LIERAGAKVVGCAFVIELLGLGGRNRIAPHETISMIQYD
jgi:adenine/guanine phosphoribosyltransferase-like PRPP-binding protein